MKDKTENRNLLTLSSRLFVDQLLAIFATVIISLVSDVFKGRLELLNMLLPVALFGGICYSDGWKKGSSDRNRIRLGLISKNYYIGLLSGLIFAIPSFLLALFAFLSESGYISVYDVLGSDIFTTINRMWQMPLGMFFHYVNKWPVLNFAVPLFAPILCETGYILGLLDFSLKNYFLYKDVQKDVPKE